MLVLTVATIRNVRIFDEKKSIFFATGDLIVRCPHLEPENKY